MKIINISKEVFDEFSSTHTLRSFYQTSSYAESFKKDMFDVIYLGGYKDNSLVAASMILIKSIAFNIKYGYAPRGFLIDFYDTSLLREWSEGLKDFFNKKNIAFIKINPEITLNIVDYQKEDKFLNVKSNELVNTLKNFGYEKLKDNMYFESQLPKYNPILDIGEFNLNDVNKIVKNKMNNISRRGLSIVKGDKYNINAFYEFIITKNKKPIEFYKKLYDNFENKDMIDLFLVYADYNEYLKSLQIDYADYLEENESINHEFSLSPNSKTLFNVKMQSDQHLNELHKEISDVSIKLSNKEQKVLIAAALCVKQGKRVNIIESGFDKEYPKFSPNYYITYKLIEYYKNNGFNFIDLNGMSGDMSSNNPYKGLNEFKLNFNPTVYEYIGEFDFVLNPTVYQLLWNTKKLEKEFKDKIAY